MFSVTIEGEVREELYAEEVVDHVTCNVCFEVDREDLEYRLDHMEPEETLVLRDDCVITCTGYATYRTRSEIVTTVKP